FSFIDVAKKIQEEGFDWYSLKIYYPIRIGEVFQSRYEVLTKLGYGRTPEISAPGRLRDHRYVALKVCISDYPSVAREKGAYNRLRSLRESPLIQKCWDSFTIQGREGAVHEYLVLEPLCSNLAYFGKHVASGWENLELFRATATLVFDALRFLHTEAHLIHCDLREENFLLRTASDGVFQALEEYEAREPSPRKVDGEHVVHTTSVAMYPDDITGIVLTDFGETRPGDASTLYNDDIQSLPYRAPEVLLDIPFWYPVDVWNAGVMLWHMFEAKPLFHPFTSKGEPWNVLHLRQMVNVMGLPPLRLLERSINPEWIHKQYFDRDGQWIGVIPVHSDRGLEWRENRLHGEERAEFLRFMRRCLQWEPEKRATAAELCEDPWLKPATEETVEARKS
ncbi:kinase-like protein, partial [Gloeophyllum trabeum ATCC 11539]